MSQTDDHLRRQAWTSYWSSGRMHSCAGSYEGNYGGAIAGFWRDFFTRVRPGGRLLDVATGNGPLPHMLWELGKGTLDLDAVDLADLAPAWYDPGRHAGVRFHSGVRIEALPFEAASFDGVVSQFGFEYAQRAPALAECLRVARPQASIALVMHHAGSVLVRVGREELHHHARLVAEDGLFATAREVMPWIAQARAGLPISDPPAATRARERYNRAMEALAAAAQASSTPDLLLETRDTVHRLVAGMAPGDAPSALATLDAYEAELERARLRTAEMVSHALDAAQLEQLREHLQAARPGIAVQCGELRQSEGVVAWSLVAGPLADAASDAATLAG